MAINDALSAVDVSTDTKELAKLVKHFPVRDGEKPWTAREVKDVAEELTSDIDRLTAELAAADAELSDLLRNSGDGAGDDQADSGSSALEREQERSLLERKIDELRVFERDYRTRLKSYLENLLGDLDNRGNALPPRSGQPQPVGDGQNL